MARITHQIGALMGHVGDAFDRRKIALFALCNAFQQEAKENARKAQDVVLGQGNLWTNRTGDAIQGVDGYAEMDDDGVGWGLMHTMGYGKWLELKGLAGTANVQPLLNPTVRKMAPDFFEQARAIFNG